MTNIFDAPEPNTVEEAQAGFEAAYRVAVPDNAFGGRGLDLPSLMFKQRILYLHGPVTQEAMHSLCMQVHYLCAEQVLKSKRSMGISVYIDSPGGLVDWGLTFFDYLRQAEEITGEPVTIIIQTQGASMGSLLPQAATTGFRLMMPRSQMMIHALSSGSSGKLEEQAASLGESTARAIQLYEIYINKIVACRELFDGAEDTPELRAEIFGELLKLMENADTFLSPYEAMKLGLIDYVAHNETDQYYWYKMLQSYYGLVVREVSDKTGTSIESFIAIARNENNGLVPKRDMDDPAHAKEKDYLLGELRRLRAENMEKTRQIEGARAPIEKALDHFHSLTKKGRRGPNADSQANYKAAAAAYLAALKAEKSTGDDA